MLRSRDLRRREVIGRVCAALALLVVAAPARAEMVQNWQDAANYPARVAALYWGSTRLDANSSVRFGAWTVRFAPQGQYIATWLDLPDVSPRTMEVIVGNELDASKALVCTNAVSGQEKCQLNFILHPGQRPYCEILKRENSFVIPCPTALDLQQ